MCTRAADITEKKKPKIQTHILSPDLLLSELHLYQRSNGGEEFPPWPVLHTTVLLDILLDAPDGKILDLSNKKTHKHTI